MDLVKALNSQYMKEELPEVKVGDTVRVHKFVKFSVVYMRDFRYTKDVSAPTGILWGQESIFFV